MLSGNSYFLDTFLMKLGYITELFQFQTKYSGYIFEKECIYFRLIQL